MNLENWNRNWVPQLVVGSLIGSGMAILFAPQSGRKTRQDIRRLGILVEKESRRIQFQLRRSINNISENITQNMDGQIDRACDWTDKAARRLSQTLVRFRHS